ncbi:hypothetical protein MIMGU_mgv1a024196mg, partial [Erythranthe guttata]
MKRKKEKEEEEHKKMEKRGRGRPKKIKIAPQSHNLIFNRLIDLFFSFQRIPPDFIEKFGRKKPAIVTLKTTSGISFRADMNKINKCWYLEKGWSEFVKENSVEEGDFLTFSYAGKSVFNVKVFAKNGCIKTVDNLEEDEPSEPGLATLFNRVIFSRGWIKFARDNSLRDGNLCTFRKQLGQFVLQKKRAGLTMELALQRL